jgi:hypothetical protein
MLLATFKIRRIKDVRPNDFFQIEAGEDAGAP